MTQPDIAGPDPDTKTPDLPTPPGACDVHAHVFGPADRFPYTEGRGYTPPDAPLETYLAHLDALGMARGVVVQGNAHGYDNAAILDACARTPDRLRGVAITDEDVGFDTLRQWHDKGIRALRFHHLGGKPGYKRGVGLDVFEHFKPMLLELGWHMHVFLDLRALDSAEDILRAAGMPVVIDHMGLQPKGSGAETPELARLLRLLGDGACWVKLSGAYRHSDSWPDYPEAQPIHAALVRTNPEQLLWGSDWPHTQVPAEIMPNDGVLLDLFNAWTPDAETRRRILVDNPARLFGF